MGFYPLVPCLEHVRAGGGGGSVTIGLFICLYVWTLVTRVGRTVVVVHSSGCHCLGDHASLQVRTSTVARASGNTWWDSQLEPGR